MTFIVIYVTLKYYIWDSLGFSNKIEKFIFSEERSNFPFFAFPSFSVAMKQETKCHQKAGKHIFR